MSCFWAVVAFLRREFYPAFLKSSTQAKVICVGNIHSGGSGKTPLILELIKHFQKDNPSVLSRGYGGKLSSQGAKVEKNQINGAELYGDEPWMLAQRTEASIYISKDRVKGVQRIEHEVMSKLVFMDDGFQHLPLNRGVDIICINIDKKPEESFCLPLGELREPISAIRKAHIIILTPGVSKTGLETWKEVLNSLVPEIPYFEATRKMDCVWNGESEQGLMDAKYLGFCGVAEPNRFRQDFASVFPSGRYYESFPDHDVYNTKTLELLVEERNRGGYCGLVTTDKDWYKLRNREELSGEKLLSLRISYRLPPVFWELVERKIVEN